MLLASASAFAQRDSTRYALTRLEASLTTRITESSALPRSEVLPIIVVSAEARFEETRTWFPTQAMSTLVRVFGNSAVRFCEACMGSRVSIGEGRVETSTAALETPEIVLFDQRIRGTSEPAKVAVWLDETAKGVSLRVVDLKNSRVLWVENFDDGKFTNDLLAKTQHALKEESRRSRGDALAHVFSDIAVLPMQHISFDWTEQWGDTNANLAGLSASILDPLLGVGGHYFRIIPEAFNITVGAKVLISVPTALAKAISPDINQVIDPLITGVLVVRWPIFSSNFALVLTVSTNAKVAVGITLLNFSLLPVLP